MKRLLLLRHAKSSWDNPDLADVERPLAPRGIEAALLMGRTIAQRNWLPDRALVSSAERTLETWRLVSGEWTSRPEASFSHALYEAPADAILAEIRNNNEADETLMVVGHNPGLHDLAVRLLVDASAPASVMAKLSNGFPTATAIAFTVDAAQRYQYDGVFYVKDFGGGGHE